VGGFVDDPGVGGADTNRATERGARATLLYRPVENLSLQIIAMAQQERAHGNDVVDYNLSTGRPTIGPSSQFRYVPEPSSGELQLYSTELNYHLEWLDVVAASGYSRFHPVTIGDATQTLIDQGNTLSNPVTPVISSSDEPVSKLTQEIRMVAKRRGRFEWMLGGFFQHESLNSSRLQLPYLANGGPYVGAPFFAAYRVGTLLERAGFADVTAYLGANLDMTAGARISRLHQTSRRSLSGSIYNPAEPLVASISQQAFSEAADTYLLAARWRPISNLTVYGRAASGYRPGGARTVPPGAPAGLLDHYTSDSLWSYETGVKLRAVQERLHLDLAGFWINWTHIQALQPVGNDVLVDGNAGTARSQGVELETQYSLREGLDIGANGAFTKARFTESVPLANITAGESLQYVPRWTTTAFSSYSRPIGRGWRIQADGDFQYQSTRVDLNRTALGTFSLWNARVALSDARFRVTASIKNIANRQAFLGYGGDGFKELYGFAVNPPRTIGLSFAQSF
jgi:outer membrane receptor protein involved in Fe transport